MQRKKPHRKAPQFRSLTIRDVPPEFQPYVKKLDCSFCGVKAGELCVRLDEGQPHALRTRPHRGRRSADLTTVFPNYNPEDYPCPKCASAPGDPCVNQTRLAKTPHPPRVREALRAEKRDRDRADGQRFNRA